MVFQPGQSGNPGGRPKKTPEDVELQELARSHAPQALNALLKIATKGKSESARVSAAVALLERGFGKPVQPIESEVNVNYAIGDEPVSAEEWAIVQSTAH